MNEIEKHQMTSSSYLGIDIGGTKISISLFDVATSRIVEKEVFSSDRDCAPTEALQKITKIARDLIRRHSASPQAVGISVGGMFDVDSGCMQHAPHLPLWDGFPIVSTIQEAIGVPVYGENDANACAMAEWQYGAGRGCRHLIFLTFGTGLGGGLILNGQLYRGASGVAGEVGAIRIASDGPAVRGKPGCLEGFASGAGIAMQAKALLTSQNHPLLGKAPSTQQIAEAATAGDSFAIELMQDCGRHLGRGLAILIDAFNPEVIVLGSIFVHCESILRPTMEAAIREESMDVTREACKIAPAQLGEFIGDYAAATVAQQGKFA